LQSEKTPKAEGFCQPAEWEKHEAVWLAWPSHEELWQEGLRGAQDEFIGLCKAIADIDPASGKPRGEKLNVLVPTVLAGKQAEKELQGLPVSIYLIPFGDIWLRDTAPIFLKKAGEIATARFQFNGWGAKYVLPFDTQVAERIASEVGRRQFVLPWVLEGGSVEVDGEGTCLTSRQCLLNPNRNPKMSQAMIEAKLCEGLGVSKILWLDQGLINDHTDGHIDTMARIVGPGKVLCMKATAENDPNKEIFDKISADLSQMVDAKGRRLTVGHIPSPGAITNDDGVVMPASYLNFYIGNSTVVVPTYGSPKDQEAVRAIAEWFPSRRTVGLPAKSILMGGGAFHCISQQQPAKEV
jgi:agmatine deiminase